MRVIQYKFKKFSKIVANLCKEYKIPVYGSKYSNKIFTNLQHLFLLICKEHQKCDYRTFVEFLYDSKIPSYISLKRIPHFTTLQKFSQRISTKYFHKLIFSTRFLFKEHGTFLGADCTGMELDQASHYYCKRINRNEPVKGFVTLNCISDLYNKNILAVKIRKKRRHDSIDFPSLFHKVEYLDFDYFVADKGYDNEIYHQMIFEAGKTSLISLKNNSLPLHRTNGEFRKKVKRHFEQNLYTQREITESIFSSLKRKYGSKLRARKFKTQRIEILTRVLAYNIERAVRTIIEMLYFWKHFYKAQVYIMFL